MAYLLNLVYLGLIALASPWLAWQAWRTGKYRDGWSAKFLGRVPARSGTTRCLWLHAVSVGEVNLLAPLIERWERLHPEWEIVISTTTQTGRSAHSIVGASLTSPAGKPADSPIPRIYLGCGSKQ